MLVRLMSDWRPPWTFPWSWGSTAPRHQALEGGTRDAPDGAEDDEGDEHPPLRGEAVAEVGDYGRHEPAEDRPALADAFDHGLDQSPLDEDRHESHQCQRQAVGEFVPPELVSGVEHPHGLEAALGHDYEHEGHGEARHQRI